MIICAYPSALPRTTIACYSHCARCSRNPEIGSVTHKLTIRASKVGGTSTVPGDKSISHRVAILASLADGASHVEGFLQSEDCLATLAAMEQLGVRHQWSAGALSIHGQGLTGLHAPTRPIDCGNAGTAMRLLCGLLAAQDFDSTLIGDDSLMRRPMRRVAEPLNKLGAKIETAKGHPPIRITASSNLIAGETILDVPSAQVKTALMFAALFVRGESSVSAPGLIRNHSETLFPFFGVDCKTTGGRTRMVGRANLTPVRITIPGDFSSAAFLIVAGCIAGDSETVIEGVGLNASRTTLLNLLKEMGARIEVEPNDLGGPEPAGAIRVSPGSLRGIEVPVDAVPGAIDEFPALCVAAACAKGETVIRGAAELKVKESDRIAVMGEALNRLGVDCETRDDGMTIQGGNVLGGIASSGGDHRIAMALTVLGLVAEKPVLVEDTKCIATSFPGFSETMRKLGAVIEDE